MRGSALFALAPALLLTLCAASRAQDETENLDPRPYESGPAAEKYSAFGTVHPPAQTAPHEDSDHAAAHDAHAVPESIGAGQGSGRGTGTGNGLTVTPAPPPEDEGMPPRVDLDKIPPAAPARQPAQPQSARQQQPAQPQTAALAPAPEAGGGAVPGGRAASGVTWGSRDPQKGGAAASPEDDKSSTKQAVGKAVKDAAAMIDGFKGREAALSDLPGAGARGAGAMPAAKGAGGAPGAPDRAAPLAQGASVYRDAFKELGLTTAVGPRGETVIQKADHTPFTDDDAKALEKRIAREPRLLAADPNLYQKISREHYGQLQRDYQARPELQDTAFKHIGMTDDKRDFLHNRDCEPVSGDCNKAAKKAYKKDQPVSAEELAGIWADLDKEAREQEKAAGKTQLTGAGISGLASSLANMLGWGSGSGRSAADDELVYVDGVRASAVAAPAGGAARSAGSSSRGVRAKGAQPALSLAAAALPGRGAGRAASALLVVAGVLLLAVAVRAARA